MIVTLDGESASGKSVLAALLAERFGIPFLESGKIYRSLTLKALQASVSFEDEKALTQFVKSLSLKMREIGKRWHLVINGRIEQPEDLRSPAVTEHVSLLAKIPEIRMHVLSLQRSCYRKKAGDHLVAEGRDLGNSVFPKADFKVFVTASLEERAERRRINFAELGVTISHEEAKRSLAERDAMDRKRRVSPLRIPKSAAVLDTTGRTLLQSFQDLVKLINIRKKNDNLFYRFVRLLSFIPCFYLNLKGVGIQNLPKRGGFILASNHVSNLDPVMLGFASPRTLFYAARSSLFQKNFFFSWLIRSLNAYPLNRENPDRKTFFRFIHFLIQGRGVVYFPEGTRSRDGKLGPFKKGIGSIALRTTFPVIPAWVSGTRDAMPAGSSEIKKGKVTVRFGPAINFDDLYKVDLVTEDFEAAAKRVREAIIQLQESSV